MKLRDVRLFATGIHQSILQMISSIDIYFTLRNHIIILINTEAPRVKTSLTTPR